MVVVVFKGCLKIPSCYGYLAKQPQQGSGLKAIKSKFGKIVTMDFQWIVRLLKSFVSNFFMVRKEPGLKITLNV